MHILLQLLEDGKLTDSHGRQCSFKNAVVIMTSNIGAVKMASRKQLGFSGINNSDTAEKIEKEVLTEHQDIQQVLVWR